MRTFEGYEGSNYESSNAKQKYAKNSSCQKSIKTPKLYSKKSGSSKGGLMKELQNLQSSNSKKLHYATVCKADFDKENAPLDVI